MLEKRGIGNSGRCYCCHKYLTDPESIARAIGSECWQRVLSAMTRLASDARNDQVPGIRAASE
jgi:hypothetical protein